MDTCERDPVDIDQLHELLRDVPTGIITHEPERTEPGTDHIWPEVSENPREPISTPTP
jgi:hypothetical protein